MSVSRKPQPFAQSVLDAQQALTASFKRHRMMLFSPTRQNAIPLTALANSKLLSTQDTKLGKHWLADFTISDQVKAVLLAGGKDKIASIVLDAANVAKATVLNQVSSRQTETGNIVSVVIIQESHLSMHFIPDENIVFVDVFTCGLIRFKDAIDYISKILNSEPHYCEVERGIMYENKFIPGIAREENNMLQMLPSGRNELDIQALGRHIIMEVYLCDFATINDGLWIQEAFGKAFIIAGGKLQDNFVHHFTPQGVSEVSIASGIQGDLGGHCHLTIHTYPEFGYAAVDIFDATQQLDLGLMVNYLKTTLQSAFITTNEFLRGTYVLDHEQKKKFVNCLIGEPVTEETYELGMRCR
jgi:S-adenosylmethionine decarboxylase